jgi:dephospho-CoA kinase
MLRPRQHIKWNPNTMIRLGLTGSIGSGKSTVAQLLRSRGIPVLDADAIARQVSRDPGTLEAVSLELGPEYVLETDLNRPKVAALIFNNPEARAKLNAIIHPRVRAEMTRLQSNLELEGTELVVQDIPLLFENGYEKIFDATILVDVPLEDRIARVQARDGLTREAILARDTAQMPASEKRLKATYILENDGDLAHLERQLIAVLKRLEN